MDRKIQGEIRVNMSLKTMGWSTFFAAQWEQFAKRRFAPRLAWWKNCRGLYRIRTETAEFLAEVETKLRRSGGYPAVGDWVGVRSGPRCTRKSSTFFHGTLSFPAK